MSQALSVPSVIVLFCVLASRSKDDYISIGLLGLLLTAFIYSHARKSIQTITLRNIEAERTASFSSNGGIHSINSPAQAPERQQATQSHSESTIWLTWFMEKFWAASGKYKMQKVISKSLEKAMKTSLMSRILPNLFTSGVEMGSDFNVKIKEACLLSDDAENESTLLKFSSEILIEHMTVSLASSVETDVTRIQVNALKLICNFLIRFDDKNRLIMYSIAKDESFKIKIGSISTNNLLLRATLSSLKSTIISVIKHGIKKS